MRSLWLASTVLAAGTGVAAAQTAINPGGGSLTDAGGNVWLITADGSIQENGRWTPGGGGTAALTIMNGTVYGLDASGKGWFTLSGNGQYWSGSAAPAGDRAREGGVTVPSARATTPAGQSAPENTASATAAATAAPAGQTTSTAATTLPVTTCAATAGGAASSGFTTSNGNILAPDGSVFIAKGIDIMEGDQPSVSTLKADFPGINFVRFAVYDEAGASTLSPWVTSLTSAGIVVEIEHHIAAGGGVPALTGSALSAENNWFQGLATAFKSNPYVWFGTINEPASGGGLGAEQSSNYQTIRGAGNNTIIMISAPVEAANASSMTGVVDDHHYYGWNSGYSTDQTTVTNDLTRMISTDQQQMTATGKIPVIIGEYGNSTNGVSIDPNAGQVLAAVQSSGYGSAAWAWGSGNPGDGLTTGGNGLSSYGQAVAGYIALVSGAPASIWSASCNGAPVITAATPAATTAASTASGSKAANVTVASAGTSGTADTSQQTAAAATPDTTALDSTAAAQADASNAAIAAADAQAPAVAATVQQATAAGARADAGLARVLATMRGGQ